MAWQDDEAFSTLINTFTNDYNQRKKIAERLLAKNGNVEKIQQILKGIDILLIDNIVQYARDGSQEYRFEPQPDWVAENFRWVNDELDSLNRLRVQSGLPEVDRKITAEGINDAEARTRAQQERAAAEKAEREARKAEQERAARKAEQEREAIYAQQLEKGINKWHNQRYSEALPHFEAALRQKPDAIHARARRGAVLEKIPGRAQEGKVELAAARQMQPISADDHFGLGWMAYSIDKNNELAQQHATKAIICDPDYAYSYVLRGVLLHDQENYDWAIADFTTAIAKGSRLC